MIADPNGAWDAGFGAATRLRCLDCGHAYDPAQGDPARGVPQGTAFARLPDVWTCPGCGAPPHRFARPGDEARRLEGLLTAYRTVGDTDMRGVAIGNPSLRVEAVGFQPCTPGQIGCVVAPWFLNAVLMPEDPGLWAGRRDGDPLTLALPSGSYRFNAARMGALGVVAVLPLASDMGLFAGPQDARRSAALALGTLMRPPGAPEAPPPAAGLSRRSLFGRRPA